MRLHVNGEPRELPESASAMTLLEALQLAPERVVVEVNLKILKRAELAATRLQEGDQVEIVHFVGGGSTAIADRELRIGN